MHSTAYVKVAPALKTSPLDCRSRIQPPQKRTRPATDTLIILYCTPKMSLVCLPTGTNTGWEYETAEKNIVPRHSDFSASVIPLTPRHFDFSASVIPLTDALTADIG